MATLTDEEVVGRWRQNIVQHASKLDSDSDKGGHDWESLWSGFVIALGRPDLATYLKYIELGFAQEQYANQPWEFKK